MNEVLFISKLKLACQLSLIDNRSVSNEILRELMSMTDSEKVKSRISIMLGEFENVKVCELTFNQCLNLVKRKSCPSNILEDAYKYWPHKHGNDHELMKVIAAHLNTPTYILSKMIVDRDNWRVRDAAAGNPNTLSADLEGCLENDDDTDVLKSAANNPSMPIEALVESSKSDNEDRRWAVATSSRLPSIELDRLVDDEYEVVFDAVIENSNLAMETIIWLLYSDVHKYHVELESPYSEQKEIANFLRSTLRSMIKKNPELKSRAEELESMATLGVRSYLKPADLSELDLSKINI